MIKDGIEVSVVAWEGLLAGPRGDLNNTNYTPTNRGEKLGIRVRVTPDYVPGDETALMFRLSYWKDDTARQSFERLTERLAWWQTGSDMTLGPFASAPIHVQPGHIVDDDFVALEPGSRPWDHNSPDYQFHIYDYKSFKGAFTEDDIRQAYLPIQHTRTAANSTSEEIFYDTVSSPKDGGDVEADEAAALPGKELQKSILELAIEEVALRRQLLELDL